jgi:hypothetical protein
LMSDTGLVLNAAFELRESSGHMALCARPELVMILDVLGFTKDPNLAHARATELLARLNDLRNSLSRQLKNAENPYAEEAARAATERIRAALIQQAAAGLLAPDLVQVEILTNAIRAGVANQEIQRGAETSFLRFPPAGFIHLLDRLGNALNAIKTFDYKPRQHEDIKASTFDSLCIDLDRTPSKGEFFQILFNRFYGQSGAVQYWRAEFVHQKKEVELVRFLNAGLPRDNVTMFSHTSSKNRRFPLKMA